MPAKEQPRKGKPTKAQPANSRGAQSRRKSRKESVGFLLVDASRLLKRAFQAQLGSLDLTLGQARALVYIANQEGVRQVELAEQLEVQPITMARLIDQLCELGLAERRPHPSDRRAHLIYLTDAADAHLEAIDQVTADIRKQALMDLSAEEIDLLSGALRKIRNRLSQR